MPTVTKKLSKNSQHYIELYTRVDSQNRSSKYSTIYYRVRLFKTSGTGWWANSNNYSIDTNNSGGNDIANEVGFKYDSRNGKNTGDWTIRSGTFRRYHRSDGSGEYRVSVHVSTYNLGTASLSTGEVGLARLANVPGKTDPLGIDLVKPTSFRYQFHRGTDGGSSITGYQVGYGTSSSSPQKYVSSGGTSTITGLKTETRYYVWSRSKNAVGWGPWSDRLSTVTGGLVPPAPWVVRLNERDVDRATFEFRSNGTGGGTWIGWQVGYGTSSSAPQLYASSGGTFYARGLKPATRYYFWARGRNSVGYGPWSPRATIMTMAGCRIKYQGNWRYAVAYVRVNGVWKVARPYTKIGGKWKITD